MPDTRRWRGNAPAVAQVTLVTIYHVENGVVYTLTHGGKSVAATADGSSTTTTIMTALAAAWNASPYPQFTEVTATSDGATLTLTADNEGVPFTLTATQTGTGGNAEVKTVTISNSPTGGTWSWVDSTYGTAAALAYNISAASLTTALEVLYGSGNVTATGSNGGPFTVTFGGARAHENIPAITFTNTSLTGGNATVTVVETTKGSAGTSEVQTINHYGSPTGGTWTVTFNGFTTANLAYNISTADLQTALRLLSSIGSTGVTVGGGVTAWVVTFAGTLANTAVPLMTANAAGLTGVTISGAVATTTPGVAGTNCIQYLTQNNAGVIDEVFALSRTGTVSGGTFRLSWGSGGGITYTGNIAYNAPLYTIIAALEALALADQGATYDGPYFAPAYEYQSNWSIGTAGGALHIAAIGPVGGANIIPGSGMIDTLGIDGALLTGGGSYAFPSGDSLDGDSGGTTLCTSGTFDLTIGGQTTSTLTLTITSGVVTSPTAAQVEAALEALSTVGTDNVSVTAWSPGGGSETGARGLFVIEFINALAGAPMSLITGSGVASTPGSSNWTPTAYMLQAGVAGTNEVQTVTLTGVMTTGTFTLSFGAATTAGIAYNSDAATVDAALEAISTIPAGGVTVTGSSGGPWTVTFTGALSYQEVPALVINDNGLKVVVVETTPGVTITNEVQTISLSGSPHGGTATLTYSGQTTSALAYNAAAATIQAALEALSNLAPADVVCTGGPWPAAVVLTFGGTLAATDVAALTGSGTSLNNGSVAETSVTPITYSNTTANSGPSDVTVAVNWSGETLPVAGDTIVADQGSSPMLYNLDQLATGLAACYIYARYTGEIGLPEVNELFSDPYYEFRQQSLIVDAPIIDIGIGDGDGSGRIKITGVVGTPPTVNVYKSNTGIDNGIEAVLLVLPNTSSIVNVNRGSVGIAIYPGETSTVPTLRVGFETNVSSDATVRCGTGVTLTAIEQSGGKLTTNSAFTTLNMTDGELFILSGACATLNIDQGSVRYISNGTCTTAIVGSGGVLDFRQDVRARTLTNVSLHAGSSYFDPHGTVTLSTGVDFVRCQPSDVTLDVKPNQTWTPSSI